MIIIHTSTSQASSFSVATEAEGSEVSVESGGWLTAGGLPTNASVLSDAGHGGTGVCRGHSL